MEKTKSPFRYKKVGKDKYEYEFMSWSEWEDMMKESDMDKKSIKQIMKDLVEHIKDERPILPTDKEKYNYDRGKWISHNGYFDTMGMDDFKKEKKNNDYIICLETLRILIYQIHFFNHIIHTNDEGRDVYNNNLINEKTLENEI